MAYLNPQKGDTIRIVKQFQFGKTLPFKVGDEFEILVSTDVGFGFIISARKRDGGVHTFVADHGSFIIVDKSESAAKPKTIKISKINKEDVSLYVF